MFHMYTYNISVETNFSMAAIKKLIISNRNIMHNYELILPGAKKR